MKLTSTPSQVWCERKIDVQVVDELFTGHQDGRVDFTSDYDSPSYCPDRICGRCGIDHDFGPDFRN